MNICRISPKFSNEIHSWFVVIYIIACDTTALHKDHLGNVGIKLSETNDNGQIMLPGENGINPSRIDWGPDPKKFESKRRTDGSIRDDQKFELRNN